MNSNSRIIKRVSSSAGKDNQALRAKKIRLPIPVDYREMGVGAAEAFYSSVSFDRCQVNKGDAELYRDLLATGEVVEVMAVPPASIPNEILAHRHRFALLKSVVIHDIEPSQSTSLNGAHVHDAPAFDVIPLLKFFGQGLVYVFALLGVFASIMWGVGQFSHQDRAMVTTERSPENAPPVVAAQPPAPLPQAVLTPTPQLAPAATIRRSEVAPSPDLIVTLGAKPASVDRTHRVYVFSDPDCPFCQRLEPMLESLAAKGWSVTVFPVNVHESSAIKMNMIACAPESTKTAVWRGLMEGKVNFDATCKAGADASPRSQAFFRSLGLGSTPTLISEDGRIKVGASSEQDIIDFVNAAQPVVPAIR